MILKEFMKSPLLAGNMVKVVEQVIDWGTPMFETKYSGTFFEMRQDKSLEELLEYKVFWIDIIGGGPVGTVQVVLVKE